RRGQLPALEPVLRLVDDFFTFVLRPLELFLHRAGGAIGLAFALEVVVVGQVTGRFFDPTFDVVLLALHGLSLLCSVGLVVPAAVRRETAPRRGRRVLDLCRAVADRDVRGHRQQWLALVGAVHGADADRHAG